MQTKWILELANGEIKPFSTAGEAIRLRNEMGGNLYDIIDWQREAKRREKNQTKNKRGKQ